MWNEITDLETGSTRMQWKLKSKNRPKYWGGGSHNRGISIIDSMRKQHKSIQLLE